MNGLTNDERRARRLVILGAVMVWAGMNAFAIGASDGENLTAYLLDLLVMNGAFLIFAGAITFFYGWHNLDG